MGNISLRWAGFRIRKVQIQGENLKALQAKFDNRGEVAESCCNQCTGNNLGCKEV